MKSVGYGFIVVSGLAAAIQAPLAAAADPATVTRTNGGILVETEDGTASFQLDGRLQYDTMFYDGIYNDGVGASASDTRVRRLRLGVSGDLDPDWYWEITYDINDDKKEAKLDHGYLRYSGFAAADVSIGRFKRPFLLEALTSSKWITFNERSLAADTARVGLADFGVMLSRLYDVGEKGKLSWYTEIANEGSEDYAPAESPEGRDRVQAYARLAWAPWAEPGNVLHFGAAFADLNPQAGGPVGISTKLGVNAASSVGTAYVVDSDRQVGLEAAWIAGPFSAQVEYVSRMLDLSAGDSATVTAGYVQLAWTLTGESRTYKPYPARMDKVKPSGEHAAGALELAVRADVAELEQPGTDDGTADTLTVGLNWYVNPHLSFKLNYLKARVDELGTVEDSGDAVSLRTGFVF